jgi:ubiquinone/menaquinone biosynthesis C-methylase UbiE
VNDSVHKNSAIEEIFQRLALISTQNALDVATGNGVFIRSLMNTLNNFNHFIGIDVSQKTLNSASRKFKKSIAHFIKMDGKNLEYNDNSFDLVSISESLHHIDDPEEVLKEINRVLHPEGIFILQESISDYDQGRSKMSDVLIHEFLSKIDILRGYYHRGFYTRQEIVKMIEKSGFKKIDFFTPDFSLKCALCKYLNYCNDSMSKKMINKGLREIRRSLRKIKDLPQYPDYKRESTIVQNKIRENGYSPARVIFILAKKMRNNRIYKPLHAHTSGLLAISR